MNDTMKFYTRIFSSVDQDLNVQALTKAINSSSFQVIFNISVSTHFSKFIIHVCFTHVPVVC